MVIPLDGLLDSPWDKLAISGMQSSYKMGNGRKTLILLAKKERKLLRQKGRKGSRIHFRMAQFQF